jgi:hypothetical protein
LVGNYAYGWLFLETAAAFDHVFRALKDAPTSKSGRFQPTPIAVVAQAIRRAWARVAEFRAGERRMLEDAVEFQMGLEGLAVPHAARQDERHDSPHRTFRAPGLVYDPPVNGNPLRRRRPGPAPADETFGMGRGSRSSDRFSR